jgi:uncharacterized protein
MKQRIIGFDLARAYAIFGMYIVNFNIVFGNYQDKSLVGQILSLFSGNSSTVFVMLAGMGIALMSNRASEYTTEDKKRLKRTVNKRAGFLFITGLVFSVWWPADILHFYGGYMYIAVFLLFVDKRYYIIIALITVIIFHLMLVFIPYETGWNFEALAYKDFWTINGFLRNTFYNGWNSIFPWFAYFVIGIYLGRMNWALKRTQIRMFIIGLSMFLFISCIQLLANIFSVSEELFFFINADYLPPFLPFTISTIGFGLMLISVFMFIGSFVSEKTFANNLAKTGQMTLTHYISHLTIGVLIFTLLSGKEYSGHIIVQPIFILLFSIVYFILSYYFSKYWATKFKNGPFEMLMRRVSG